MLHICTFICTHTRVDMHRHAHTHTGVHISEMDSLINLSLCIDLCNHHPDKAMESFQCTRRLPGAMMRRAETIGLKKRKECLSSF